MNFGNTEAAKRSEREWMMKAILGPPVNFSNKDDMAAAGGARGSVSMDTVRTKAIALIDVMLTGLFATAIWRQAVYQGTTARKDGLLTNVMKSDMSRQNLKLNFNGVKGDHLVQHLADLCTSWPPRLINLHLDLGNCTKLPIPSIVQLFQSLNKRLK